MNVLKTAFLFVALTVFGTISAQQRYLQPVFTGVTRSAPVSYGQNFTILPLLGNPPTRPVRQPLVCQIYQPTGDNNANRPLIIYVPTGNFIPFPTNQSCGGTIGDSSCVEFATRLARMGYVVAVMDYRKGWNPFATGPTGETVRRATLINAAYRGVQDARTCIRFFRRNVVEGGNTYRIDPSKIVLWGQGTGGYISLATAYLNTFGEIATTSDPNKFRITAAGGFPMVQERYNGDIFGTSGPHLADATYAQLFSPIQAGDTLAVPNHVGFSSAFNLAVNMGGAIGDSTWLDAGEMPLISYHVPSDNFAPCKTDVLNVPSPVGSQPVVEVSGSCDLQSFIDKNGNNRVFRNIPAAFDPLGPKGRSNGFYAFVGTPDNNSGPWEWTNLPSTINGPCNTNGRVARIYIDTILRYFAPRAFVALNLGTFTSTKELLAEEVGLAISPVPALDGVTFTAEQPMTGIFLYDVSGRLVQSNASVNNTAYRMERNGLPTGLYFAEVRFEKGFVTKKIVLE